MANNVGAYKNISQDPKWPSLCIELQSEKGSICQKLLKRNCSYYLDFTKNARAYSPYTAQELFLKCPLFLSYPTAGLEQNTLKTSKFSPSVQPVWFFPLSACFLFTDWSLWFLFTFLNLQLVPKFFIMQGIQELAQQARISLPFLLLLSANLSQPITLILHPSKAEKFGSFLST